MKEYRVIFGKERAEIKRRVKAVETGYKKIHSIEIGIYSNGEESEMNMLLSNAKFSDKINIDDFKTGEKILKVDDRLILDCWCYSKDEELITNVYVEIDSYKGIKRVYL